MIIASFPKGSYPEYTWPIGTWPEAPEAAVDIVYTEVFEFTLAIAATAEFELVLPNDEFINVTGTNIIVSGAGTTAVNGTYEYGGMYQDKPYYLYSGHFIFRETWEEDELCEWIIAHGDFDNSSPLYSSGVVSYIGVDTPDLVTTWQRVSGVSLPVPTVTTSAVTHSLPVSAGMVLSSDGDGHVQWTTNKVLVFDGANMSVDENVVIFELTLNGEAISKPAFVYVYVTDCDGIPQYFNEDWECAIPVGGNGGKLGFVIYTGEQTEISLSGPSGGGGGDFYLNAIMPSGAIVTSPAIHFAP